MTGEMEKQTFDVPKSNDCFICNGRIKVSKRNCFGIFDKHVTEASGSPLYFVIEKVLEFEMKERSVHSTVICKLCLKLLNEVDEMEVKMQEVKKKLNETFSETIRKLSEDSMTGPELNNSNRKVKVTFSNRDDVYVYNADEACYNKNKDDDDEVDGNIDEKDQQTKKYEEKQVDITAEEDVSGAYYDDMQEMITDSDIDEEYCDDIQDAPANGDHDRADGDDMQKITEGGYPKEESSDDMEEDDDMVFDPSEEAEITVKLEQIALRKANEKLGLPEKLVEKEGMFFVCLLCPKEDKIMGDRKSIVAHLKDIHNIRVYICDICIRCFLKRKDLSEHLDNHVAIEEGNFQCGVCKEVFHNVRTFETHKRLHFPSIKMWNCDTCGKGYSARGVLEEHINTHIGLRPYACKMCEKTFTSKYLHKAHLKIHENRERSFTCQICDKSFFRETSLKQHQRLHSDVRNYVCEQCGKAFSTARYLEVHKFIHTGHKPFACRICNKVFARRAEMVNHERIHTGEKPYQCEMCGATFRQCSNLRSHKRATHYQDKRHKCTLCDKAFKRKRLLDYHTKAAHTGERPHKCPTCNAGFVYPHHFKKHMRLHLKKD